MSPTLPLNTSPGFQTPEPRATVQESPVGAPSTVDSYSDMFPILGEQAKQQYLASRSEAEAQARAKTMAERRRFANDSTPADLLLLRQAQALDGLTD